MYDLVDIVWRSHYFFHTGNFRESKKEISIFTEVLCSQFSNHFSFIKDKDAYKNIYDSCGTDGIL